MLILMISLLISVPVSGELSNQQDTSEPSLQLMRLDLEFGVAAATRGLEGWMSFFAEDASIFPEGSAIITGVDKIRAYYEETGFDPKSLSWKPVKAEVSSSADMGYTIGYWEIRTEGAESSASGKYVTVWKKQKDGSWKVAADIGNR
jgi:ketosteroid isomerase-like protein